MARPSNRTLVLSFRAERSGAEEPGWGKPRSRPLHRPWLPSHPGVGGEGVIAGGELDYDNGSSPRRRGTHQNRARAETAKWFIPARAGNTFSTPRAIVTSSVHPRAGRELVPAPDYPQKGADSSPRGRGTRRSRASSPAAERFIPARAGNTPPGRFISARAGNTSASAAAWSASGVHPRAGGEHRKARCPLASPAGSSPRGRGTLPHQVPVGVLLRFIPARAGNTARRPPRGSRSTVHPRAGGEHADSIGRDWRFDGSSPRGRGTLTARHPGGRRRRFIPARAGNTWTDEKTMARPSVRPRAGGEHGVGPAERAGCGRHGRGGEAALLHRLERPWHGNRIPVVGQGDGLGVEGEPVGIRADPVRRHRESGHEPRSAIRTSRLLSARGSQERSSAGQKKLSVLGDERPEIGFHFGRKLASQVCTVANLERRSTVMSADGA